MKKTIGFLTAVFLFLIGLTVPTAAVYTISPLADTVPAYEAVYNAVYEALDKQQSYLDISRYKIKDYDIMDIFTDVMNNSPEFFYASRKLSYRYDKEGMVLSLSFTYTMSHTARAAAVEEYEKEISYIVNEVQQHFLADAERALYVHDYLISSYSYDETETVFDAYHFLKERKGVCHAYSLCYIAVMRELGIPCFMVVSEEMNHSWNLVLVDGEWYHVDLVFDDPSPDRPGQVHHKHFLLSDSSIAEDRGHGKHYGWSSSVICTNEKYTKPYWQFSDTRMIYMNDSWYYIDEVENSIRRLYFNGHGTRILYLFHDTWKVDLSDLSANAVRWKGLYSGFGVYEGYLYFNTPDTIWRLHPSSGETEKLLWLEEDGLNIYGIDIYKNKMEYLIGNSPDRNATAYVETLAMDYLEEEEKIENVFLPFADISRVSPYYPAVEYLYEAGIVQGMTETHYDLNGIMTRVQFAALLSRLYGFDITGYKSGTLYTDVPENSWYAPYVAWVTVSGFMNGVGGGCFDPDSPVTREQMLTVLASVGRSLKLGSTELQSLDTIDRNMISDWAVNGVDYCYTNGLVSERYTYILAPNTHVRRSEIADVLYRFCKLMEWEDKA